MKAIYRRTRDGSVASEAEALTEDDILRDGYSVSVPLLMRDGRTRTSTVHRDPFGRLLGTSEALEEEEEELNDAALLVTDAAGGWHGLHRPGFRLPVNDAAMRAARDAVERAYAEAELADANAWRGNAVRPESAEDRTLDQITADRLSLLDERERAYLEVEERDRNAWRNPR